MSFVVGLVVESSLVVPLLIPVEVIEHASTALGTFLFLSFFSNFRFLFYCFRLRLTTRGCWASNLGPGVRDSPSCIPDLKKVDLFMSVILHMMGEDEHTHSTAYLRLLQH